jgi:hypothetical protein
MTTDPGVGLVQSSQFEVAVRWGGDGVISADVTMSMSASTIPSDRTAHRFGSFLEGGVQVHPRPRSPAP